MILSPRTVVSALLGLVFGVATLLSGFDPFVSDIKYDWVVARAALHSDAYADVVQLAEEFGVDVFLLVPESMTRIHPRTPGAILLSIPVAVVPFDWLVAFAISVSVACVAYLVYPTLRGLARWRLRLAVVFTAVSMPVVMTLWFGTQSALIAVLIFSGWALAVGGRPRFGGSLIGAAVTLKVFPALLVIPLWLQGKRVAAGALVVSVLGFNAAGLLLPGVSLDGALAALAGAADTWVMWPPNAGLLPFLLRLGLPSGAAYGLVVIAVLVVVGLLSTKLRDRSADDPLPWVTVGLLAIPLSWVHYDLVLIPAVLALLVGRPVRQRVLTSAVLLLWLVPSVMLFFESVYPGPWFFVARLLLLIMWVVALVEWEEGLGPKWAAGGRRHASSMSVRSQATADE